ncbi:MAG: SWIM zinc finger family protein [Planctomycetota bacterium]
MSEAIAHAYRYAQPSGLAGSQLHLATSNPTPDADLPFVQAAVREPRLVALALRTVSDVVRSRHHIPAAMLARILTLADPVLTFGSGVLRVEGFSSCCGVYARADISADAFEVAHDPRPGTTNVDFNADMRAALAQVRDREPLQLDVSDTAVTLTRNDERVVERKVTLPLRWVRGFLEVQAVQRRMELRVSFDRTGAIRFLRSLPRSGRSSDASWLVPMGGGVRLSSTPCSESVRLAGFSRLRALEPALPLAQRLDVYDDPVTGASAWRLDCGNVAITAVLSPEVWRGFSGEGQALKDLALDEPRVERVRALLAWQSELSSNALAKQAKLPADELDRALAWLASRGLVGFDVARAAWFHRVLPFDMADAMERIEAQHPRLKNARKLVAAEAVQIRQIDADGVVEGDVISKDVTYRVRIAGDDAVCTCPWFSKHQHSRGPCKHVLAVQIVLDQRGRRPV